MERATRFHQDGGALLTVETCRAWLSSTGLALYLPRPEQLPAPAPSFVEATLGATTPEPSPEQMDQARGILARLIGEGACVPLNLLGATGASGTDTPDFLCSPAVFSFLFTLRGNKAWKTAPVTNGPVKVSPLALATYEQLVAKVTMSAYDLTTQLGKEVTEAAVLRALTELWQQLRVLPVPQTDGSATLWELSTARFTKQIKAGANAGQPTALSALISLYLNQAIAATEDEVETFLSPLAPRSRLRSVVHDLLAARQLETIVIDGKTLVHVTGDLPAFTSAKPQTSEAVEGSEGSESGSTDQESEPPAPNAEGRIRKFAANPAAKLGTGLRARPAFGTKPAFGSRPVFGSKPAFGRKPGFGSKPGFGDKPAYGRPDRERRPFGRDGAPARPSFNKPWQEDRPARPQQGSADGIAASGDSAGAGDRPYRPKPSFGSRPPFRDKPAYGGRPDRPDRPERPRRDFGAGDARPPRPGGFGARPPRPFAGKSGFSPREGGEGRGERPSFPRSGGFSRGPRTNDSSRNGAPRRDFGSSEGRPPRRDFGSSESRPPRRDFGGDRPAGGGFKRPGSFSGPRDSSGPRDRPGGFAPKRPYTPREGGDRPAFGKKPGFGGKPGFGARPSFSRPDGPASADGEAPRKTFRKFDAPRGPKPFGAKRDFDGPRSSGPRSGPRPSGSGPGKPPSAFAAKGGPFAKFADGKKPFRKPGKPSGGFTPVKRKRPEDEA